MVKVNVRTDIDAAAERLSSAFGSKREIAKLPEFLWEGETVEMLAAGSYGGGLGLLAMTDRRLIFLKHGFMSQKLEDFPYANISSVQWQGGMVQGTLTVYASGNKAEIKNITKADGKAMSDKLRQVVSVVASPAGQVTQEVPVPGQDVASRLATLEQLRTAGAITDAEYQDRRSKVLDSL